MAIEKLAWYKDEVDALTKGRKENQKKYYAAPEMLYDLDGDQTINTINEFEGNGCAGTLGAEKLDLGGKGRVIDATSGNNDTSVVSNLSTMSRENLIVLLKK